MPGIQARMVDIDPATAIGRSGDTLCTASRANSTALVFMLTVSSARPALAKIWRLVEKVLAVTTSAPARIYSSCTSRTMSGWVLLATPHQAEEFISAPNLAISLPVAPSRTMTSLLLSLLSRIIFTPFP